MRTLMIALAALLSLAAPAHSGQANDPAGPSVAVTRDGDAWTADYVFDRDAPVWAFFRSALTEDDRRAWRPEQWRVVTPGVVLERVGGRDILRTVGGGPVPRHVRIAFTPRADKLEAEYEVLVFSDGSVAMPSGLFDVFPLGSVAEVEGVPLDLNGFPLATGPATVTWRDRAGPVLFKGERLAEATAAQAETYVLFGQAGLVESERLVTVIDPELPAWIAQGIAETAPRMADYYGRHLGPGQSGRPTVMVSWAGQTHPGASMSGSVMPGLIVMNFSGARVIEPNPEVLDMASWFIAHESAHFWLGQVVRYERERDAWITEGGADLMAIRGLAALDPGYDAASALRKAIDDCARLGDEPVVEAAGRGEHRALYACGAVFGLVAEGAQGRATGGDAFDFLSTLIDASRADGVLTRAEWLDALDAVSGDPSLRRDIEGLLDQGSSDAAGVVAGLLERSGASIEGSSP